MTIIFTSIYKFWLYLNSSWNEWIWFSSEIFRFFRSFQVCKFSDVWWVFYSKAKRWHMRKVHLCKNGRKLLTKNSFFKRSEIPFLADVLPAQVPLIFLFLLVFPQSKIVVHFYTQIHSVHRMFLDQERLLLVAVIFCAFRLLCTLEPNEFFLLYLYLILLVWNIHWELK